MQPGAVPNLSPLPSRSAGAPAPVAVAELRRAAEIPAAEWDRLARRGFHLHRWFATAEAGADLRPRHLALRAGGELAVVFPAYLEISALHGDLHHRWLGAARDVLAAVGLRLRPTLAVTVPFANSSEPLGDLSSLPTSALREVFERFEEQARRDGAKAVVWPALGPAQDRLVRLGKERGYTAVLAGSTAVLDAPQRFEDYVAARGRNVRRTVRAELRGLSEAAVRLEIVPHFRAFAPRMDAFYRAAFRRRNGREAGYDRDFFARLAAEPSREIWAQLSWQGERLLAMSLNLVAGDTMDGTFGAYDRAHARDAVYFNDLVYAPVRAACESGIRRIDLGPSCLYPKILRGGVLLPRTTLVRGLSPSVRAFLAGWSRLVDARIRTKERRALGPLAARQGVS